jgi:hypothetical protein
MASEITAYHIYIRESDGITYSEEFTYCDGSDDVIIAAKSCSVPVSILRGSYFNLEWGSSIYAKLVAVNVYGDSVLSEEGNGAVMITAPDAPINLALVESERGSTQIGL